MALFKRTAGASIEPGGSWCVRDRGASLTLFSAALDPACAASADACLRVKTSTMRSAVQVCRLRANGKEEHRNLISFSFGAADMPCEFSVDAGTGAATVHLCASLETPCDDATLQKLTANWQSSQP